MAATQDETLVSMAWRMALLHRRPEAGFLFHSDRGSQDPRDASQALLADALVTVSMSRTGNCYDNAVKSLPQTHQSFEQTDACGRVVSARCGQVGVSLAQFGKQARELYQPDITEQVIGSIFPLDAAAYGFNQGLVGKTTSSFKGSSCKNIRPLSFYPL